MLFRKKETVIAHPLEYRGEGTYEIPLKGSRYGLVFEENEDTGYLYVTDSRHSEIFDALHLYDRGEGDALRSGDEVFVVWAPGLQKVGFYYRERFQAVVDFGRQEARCRSGFPSLPNTPWLKAGHAWRDDVVSGLEP